jgi:hypothetical protein
VYVSLQYEPRGKAALNAKQGELGRCGGHAGWREVPGGGSSGPRNDRLPKADNKYRPQLHLHPKAFLPIDIEWISSFLPQNSSVVSQHRRIFALVW